MLISPLARKLCAAKAIDPATLKGTGPKGRIMARDVVVPRELPVKPAPFQAGQTVIACDILPPTRPEKEGYYVYDCEVDMRALASISLPIAVQCEKLFEHPYNLMHYILRALTKSCGDELCAEGASMDVLLFENSGQNCTALCYVKDKTIYHLAQQTYESAGHVPEGFVPNVILCDANTTREQVRANLEDDESARYAMVIRGGTPKVGIQVGCKLTSMMLYYTFYVSSSVPRKAADHTASRLNVLLYNPVSLLFIS